MEWSIIRGVRAAALAVGLGCVAVAGGPGDASDTTVRPPPAEKQETATPCQRSDFASQYACRPRGERGGFLLELFRQPDSRAVSPDLRTDYVSHCERETPCDEWGGMLGRLLHRSEPPSPYHHPDFHPVPVRPPLAPAWMGPGDDVQLRAARTAANPQGIPKLPEQQIEIVPPPMPEQSPRGTPDARSHDPVIATTGRAVGASGVGGSWIFAASELGRRDPTPIEARRPDSPSSPLKR